MAWIWREVLIINGTKNQWPDRMCYHYTNSSRSQSRFWNDTLSEMGLSSDPNSHCEFALLRKIRFASLRRILEGVRFAIITTNSQNCEFAELRKIAKAKSHLVRKFWPSYEKIFRTGRNFRFIAKNCEAKRIRFASQKNFRCSLRFRFAIYFKNKFAFAIDFCPKFGPLV